MQPFIAAAMRNAPTANLTSDRPIEAASHATKAAKTNAPRLRHPIMPFPPITARLKVDFVV